MSSSPWNKYIVITGGSPTQLNEYKNTPKGGILLIALPGTLFSSRNAAKAAIKRTLEFAATVGLSWNEDEYHIYRVQEDTVLVSKTNY